MNQEKPKVDAGGLKVVKILSYLFYVLFAAVFLFVVGQLFLQNQVFTVKNQSERGSVETLRVIFPLSPTSLDPADGDPSARQRLVNIYQPLVKFDAFYNVRPCLALSWGMIDDYTWEFNLRPDVVFHDGTVFDAKDVDATFRRLHATENSTFSQFIDSFDSFEIVDDLTVRIKTKYPDPLLLQKLALILVNSDETDDFTIPNGTGPYMYLSSDTNKTTLSRFDKYWGDQPVFETVELITIPNKSDRVNAFLRGDADMLAFVPYDAVSVVNDFGFNIATVPTLEVQLIMYNFNSKYFSNKKNRQLVSDIIDQKSLVEDVGGYARPVNQFVSNGIFGFDPAISDHKFDLKEAQDLAIETGLKGKTLQLHLPVGLDVLGEHIRKNLSKIGVNLIISYLNGMDFIDSIDNAKADFYFMGFKSELGDSSEFLQTMIHSEGEYNTLGYENSNVDYLIDLSSEELSPTKRQEALQEAMRVIVEDDVVGVPLFEYETVYAFVDGIDFSPRLDGLIYFDKVNLR